MPRIAFLFCDFQSVIRDFPPPPFQAAFDNAVVHAEELLKLARDMPSTDAVVIHVAAAGNPRHEEALYSVNASSPLAEFMNGPIVSGVTADHPKIVSAVSPLDTERVYLRPRASPFHDTRLNTDLRTLGVEEIVICGVATSGVVISAFRSAIDADYRVIVAKDACADLDEDMHRVLTEKYFHTPFFGSQCIPVTELKVHLKG